MITPRRDLQKSEFARKIGISKSTLYRFLKEHESEIKEIDPYYIPAAKLLHPIVIDFIIKVRGYDHDHVYKKAQ